MKTAETLQNIFYFGLFFVYLPILPIDLETQPFIALVPVLIYLIHKIINEKTYKISEPAAFVLSLTFILVARLLLDIVSTSKFAGLIWLIKYLVGPCAFIYASQLTKPPPYKMLVYVMAANILLLSLLSIEPFASYINQIMNLIYMRYSTGDKFRGVSLFSPEPSYTVNYILLFILFGFFYAKNNKIKYSLLVVGALLLLSNRSMTAYAYLTAALAWFLVKSGTKFRLIALGSIFSVSGLVTNSERISLMIDAAKNIDLENIVLAISIIEPSGSTRVLVNTLALAGGLISLAGNGLGSFGDYWISTVQKIGWEFYFDHEVIGRYYSDGLLMPPQSFLSSLVFDTGIAGLIWFMAFTFWYFKKISKSNLSSSHLYFIAVVFSVSFIFQGQISNPIPWAIMGMALSKVSVINSRN